MEIGDCNDEDYFINFFDLMAFQNAWGSSKGGATYNHLCDLQGDGFVNFFDLMTFQANWGKSGPIGV